jgi:hypothetical protein
MTYLFKLAQRTARLRLLPLIGFAVLSACDTERLTTPPNESDPASVPSPIAPANPSFANTFVGGIPFGMYALPTSEMGSTYNGSLRVIFPDELLSELAAIKARGGRVVLTFTGNEEHYKDSNGHFSLSMWKARVDRYKNVNFDSYIYDGTIIGHYLIDEPNDPFNWGGQPVSGATVEAMAAYSKQYWPKLTTIVRTDPGYLTPWAPYHALDAAWAQYVVRKGTPQDYIDRNIADAQKLGLGLITGLNVRKGGPDGGVMSASLIQSAGTILLRESYPCAFISWQWDEPYESRSDVKSAMTYLSQLARAHASRSCDPWSTAPPPVTLPGVSGIALKATTIFLSGKEVVSLTWIGASTNYVDVYRDGVLRRTTLNDGKAVSAPSRDGTYTYRICEAGSTTRCSNQVSATVK